MLERSTRAAETSAAAAFRLSTAVEVFLDTAFGDPEWEAPSESPEDEEPSEDEESEEDGDGTAAPKNAATEIVEETMKDDVPAPAPEPM